MTRDDYEALAQRVEREESSRQQIQDAYIRVCRDSGFRMSPDRAAVFAARLLGWPSVPGVGLMVWTRGGITLDDMQSIADGTHPAALRALGQEKRNVF